MDVAYQFVLDQIGKNDLVAGGAMLGMLAYLLNSLRSLPVTLMGWARFAFVTQIDIPDKSDPFRWVSEWLAQHKYSKKAKRITLSNKDSDAVVTPAPGRHLVWWNRMPVLITRIRRESTGDNASRAYRESWSITMLGKRKNVEKFIEECRLCAKAEKDQYVNVKHSDHGYWGEASKRRKRPLDSVILPVGMNDLLLKDLKEFVDSKSWYYEMNIPWRRGYLLEGPPGNGKSSIITSVASEIGFDIYVINLKVVDENELVSLIAETGERGLVLLEDIDCAFDEREDRKGISLSTLLNCLDGVNATEGRVLFMTTNRVEKLDAALIRPGRIDLTLSLQNATEYQIKKLYERFYPESKNASDFAASASKLDVSMAKIQGHFLKHRHSCKDARQNIGELNA